MKKYPKAAIDDLTDTFANLVHDPSRPTDLVIPTPSPGVPLLEEFTTVIEAEVCHLWSKINSNKATGSDIVPPCFLKLCLEGVKGPLKKIITQSLRTGIFPSSYNQAHDCVSVVQVRR